jgi:hypothetical protein
MREPAEQGSRTGLKAALLALIATQAMASEPAGPSTPPASSPTQPGAELESVTVEAQHRRQRIDEEVSDFIVSVVGPAHVESLSRWKVPICALTVGLSEAMSYFVEGRVSQIAKNADIPLGTPACAPNFVIVVTPEPQELLKDWWSEEHNLFNRDRGLGGVNRMIRTDQPVRVWHNACNIPPLRGYYQPSGQLDCGVGMTGSRLTHAAVRAIYSAIVVVDLDLIEGLTLGQVADYVAMVGLVKIRPNPDLGEATTILGLFGADDARRPKGLTTWDQYFLKAIYETTDGSVTELAQIKLRMSEDLAR